MTRCFYATLLGFSLLLSAAAVGQQQPLPKPVTPPVPIPGANPPPDSGSNVARRPAPGTGGDTRQSESAVAPFLDSQTLAVVRFDLKELDLKALQDWLDQGVESLRKSDKEIVRAQLNVRQELGKPFAWVDRLKAAGADRVFVVASLEDLTSNRPPFVVIPLREGTNAKAVEDLFNGEEHGDAQQVAAREVHGAVVVAADATFDRLKAATPAQRPELDRSLEAGGPGQIHLALIPQDEARKMLESLIVELPQEVGGGSIDVVSRGIQWSALAIGLPPTPSFRLVIQATDANAAAKLEEAARKAVAWAGERKEGPREALAFTRLVAKLQPKLEGDRVVLELNADQTQQLAATLAAMLLNSRTSAMQVQSASNLRQLSTGVMMYANEHKGEFPKDLGADVNPYLGPNAKQLWIDPLRPNQKKPYVYLRLADKMSSVQNPAEAVMMYENHTTWDNGINVAFADGHVEWIADETKFRQM
ncbi:MAG TPA: H-X9-DG-CTERM domain-containing protein, partial [Tepidisphaeraceae bacterium]|nr:H-X9-DG-CTERM domain-containing protein [Tepidisphaeraceae bacterium]